MLSVIYMVVLTLMCTRIVLLQGFCFCFRKKSQPREFRTVTTVPTSSQAESSHEVAARLQAASRDRFRHSDEQAATGDNLPVSDVSNTGDPLQMYRGSWIAEVTVVHPFGELISMYQSQQRRLEQVCDVKQQLR